MSTVDSMLIMCSAAIVKDLYFHYIAKNDAVKLPPKKVKSMSVLVTGVVGTIVFFAAMNPPSLLVWINLFAFGGLEAVFLCPTLFGLYWKGSNSTGAIFSMLAGRGYSVIPMIVSLVGSCLLRLVWIATIFRMFRSTGTLYISYPISWALTAGVHLICLLVVRKKMNDQLKEESRLVA